MRYEQLCRVYFVRFERIERRLKMANCVWLFAVFLPGLLVWLAWPSGWYLVALLATWFVVVPGIQRWLASRERTRPLDVNRYLANRRIQTNS